MRIFQPRCIHEQSYIVRIHRVTFAGTYLFLVYVRRYTKLCRELQTAQKLHALLLEDNHIETIEAVDEHVHPFWMFAA